MWNKIFIVSLGERRLTLYTLRLDRFEFIGWLIFILGAHALTFLIILINLRGLKLI